MSLICFALSLLEMLPYLENHSLFLGDAEAAALRFPIGPQGQFIIDCQNCMGP